MGAVTTSSRDTKNGSFGLREHMEFLKNETRIRAFEQAFEKFARGRIVLDAGSGTGIMATLALRAGAERVIAVEKDPEVAEVARENFRRNGFEGRVTLLVTDAGSLTRSDVRGVEVLVGEMLSTWCIVEPQVDVFRQLLNLVDGKARTIPERVVNMAQGVQAKFGDKRGLIYMPVVHFEFEKTPKARGLTTNEQAGQVVFTPQTSLEAVANIVLRATRAGIINALRLTSLTDLGAGIAFGISDDTMPRMIVPTPRELVVRQGQEIGFQIQFTYGCGWEKFVVRET